MTKKEFALFAAALKTYFPREGLLPSNQAMELWYAQLCDIPYQVAETALNTWVATNKWSPSIADIREQAVLITSGAPKDWGSGWQQTLRAIAKYGYYQKDKALDSLDDLTRATVERLGFDNLCMSENQEVDRANFRMIYEQLSQRKKMENQIPATLKNLISTMKMGDNLLEEKEYG